MNDPGGRRGGNGRIDRRGLLALGTGALLGSALAAGGLPSVEERLRRLGGRAPRALQLLLPDGSQDNLDPVIETFTALSGIPVRLHVVPVDDVASVLALDRLSGQNGIDVGLPATFAMADLVDAQAVIPLEDFARQYETPDLSDGMLYDKGNRFDGLRYGYQTDGDVYLMFLNRRLFDDAGLRAGYEDRHGARLEVPQTWADLDRQMAWFHQPEAGRFGGTLFRSGGRVVWEWWLRLHAEGVWPLSPGFEVQFAGPEGLAALEALIAATASLDRTTDILGEHFGQGGAYANLGWGGTQKQLRRNSSLRDHLLVAPPPGGLLGGRVTTLPYFNWGWSYVVASGSPMPELAYLFCLMSVQPDLSTQAVRRDAGFFDPFRVEHYDDAAIREVYSPAFLDVHRESLGRAIPDFYLPGRTRYFNRLSTWLERAVSGLVTPDVALAEAAGDWRTITLEQGAEAQAAHWRALRLLYPDPLRQALRDTG